NTAQSPKGFTPPAIGVDGVGFNEERYHRLIAEWSLQQVNGALPQLYDPWLTEELYRMAASMNGLVRSQALVAVPLINDNRINAFAVSGGLIAINTGVITASKSVDETASVIAHEIAHLSLKHHERSQEGAGKALAVQLGGLLAALAASAVSGDAAAAVMLGSQTAAAETTASHSRAHEREADRVGMQLLVQAGYDPRGMARFFETLQRQKALNQSQNAFVPSFIQTHPFTLDRLSDAHSMAGRYPIKSGSLASAERFEAMQWRIKYLSKTVNEEDLKKAAVHSTGAKLAYVAYLSDKGQTATAKTLFSTLTPTDEPLYCITKAHIAYEMQDYDTAISALNICHMLYPERRDLRLYLADSLLQAGNVSAARTLLILLTQAREADILAWDLLEKSYEKESQQSADPATPFLDAYALYARSQKQLWRGRYDAAVQSLTQALTVLESQKSSPTHSQKHSLIHQAAHLTEKLNKQLSRVRAYQDFHPK
ncbi:MAG: M48 family metalloprotease, partial [Moraxella sp.]|nr:M48 family metalloprotease [Moraxella sp.]